MRCKMMIGSNSVVCTALELGGTGRDEMLLKRISNDVLQIIHKSGEGKQRRQLINTVQP